MSEHQRETAFLRHVIAYDGSNEGQKLEQSIAQVQRDQLCVERMAWMAALFLLLVIAGVGYGMVLQENFPYDLPELVFRLLCELSLALLICLVALAGLLTVYNLKLNRLREDGRQLAKRVLESQWGKPQLATLPGSQQVSDGSGVFQGTTEAIG